MTNPNNAIGTNGAFNGRTSPNALNDITAAFSKGIVSGWTCSPKTGMTVQLGGSASTRDVALAEDNAGNKLTIDNRSGAPVEVTLSGAPSTNNRIDCIVAYVDNPSTGDDSTTDNPTACGIIAVSGTVAANPTAPSDAQIRSAITTDGATGGVAYYVVLATILVGTNVTTIGSGVITQGTSTQSLAEITDGSITTDKLADGAITEAKLNITYSTTERKTGEKWINGKDIYCKVVDIGYLPNNDDKNVPHGITNFGSLVRVEGRALRSSDNVWFQLPNVPNPRVNLNTAIVITVNQTDVVIGTGVDRSNMAGTVTLWYTKSN